MNKTKELYDKLLSVGNEFDGHILYHNEEQKDLWRVLTAGRLKVCTIPFHVLWISKSVCFSFPEI